MPDVLIGGLAGQGPKGHVTLAGALANRHGLVAGATGTGKTVTLQVLAEEFSRMGVPVFTADVKGDLSGASPQRGPPIRASMNASPASASMTGSHRPRPSGCGICTARAGMRCVPA